MNTKNITFKHTADEFVRQPQPKKHAHRSSIQHWQLRDLISPTDARDEFCYVNQNNVNLYNTQTKQVYTTFCCDLSMCSHHVTL